MAAAAIAQLQSATLRGLAAGDYDADWLAREARRLDEVAPAERELARFDVSLTLALLHFIADSHAGRMRLAYADVPPEVRAPAFVPVAALRAALAQDRVAAVIAGAEPAFPIYTRLKAALARYRLPAAQPLPLLPALSGKEDRTRRRLCRARRAAGAARGYGGPARCLECAVVRTLRITAGGRGQGSSRNATVWTPTAWPGTLNALAAIKFGLPNSDHIYLHSTPAKQLFARSRRDFSHGCIRLEMAEALAQFVLRDHAEWTANRIVSK